jgi:hypothetical protein
MSNQICLIIHADKFGYTNAQRIGWIGHILRMDKERMVKRITEWRPTKVRRIGRVRLRWDDGVTMDLGKLRFRMGVR